MNAWEWDARDPESPRRWRSGSPTAWADAGAPCRVSAAFMLLRDDAHPAGRYLTSPLEEWGYGPLVVPGGTWDLQEGLTSGAEAYSALAESLGGGPRADFKTAKP